MAITQPTAIRIFVPSTIEKIDQTAEPTIEGISGEDYIGNALASTDQVVNAMDGYPTRPFQADTDADASVWRVDAALTQREQVGFLMVDQHNLRDAYPAAVKEQIDCEHYTADTEGSATVEVPEIELSGLLGRKPPRIAFNGTTDRVAIGNVANLNFDYGDFSIELMFKVSSFSQDMTLFKKRTSFGGSGAGWIIRVSSTSQLITFLIGDGSSANFVNSDAKVTAGAVCHVVAVRENGVLSMYVGGTLQATTGTSGPLNCDTSATADMGYVAAGGQLLNGKVYRARAFNRALSQSEVTSLYNGESIATADEWTTTTDLLADNQATSDERTEGNSVASWSADSGATLTSVTDDGSSPPQVVPHDGTYMMRISATGGMESKAIQLATTVAGATYRLQAWMLVGDATSTKASLFVGTTSGASNLGESPRLTVDGEWGYTQVEFTATSTSTYVSVVISNGDSSVLAYADTISLRKVGCVAEWDASGINKQDGTWYDSSSNSLDGTITGKYIDVPEESDDFYLAVLSSEIDQRYWFTKFNADGVTGTASTNALVGQVALGKVYSFSTELMPSGGYSGDYGFPGIIVQETDAGRFLTESRFGRRPTFSLTFQNLSQTDFEKLVEMIDYLEGAKYPFWVCFNYNQLDPVIWRVRLEGGLDWSFSYGSDQPYSGPSIQLVSDDT